MAIVPTGSSTFPSAAWWATLKASIADDISAAKAEVREAPLLDDGVDLGSLTTSSLYLVSSTRTHANRPDAATGILRTTYSGATSGLQEFTVTGFDPRTYKRFRGSTGYAAWVRTDAGGVKSDPRKVAPPASFKTVPLALTLGGGAATYPVLTRGIRLPMRFGAEVTRWRVHIRNINPRFGTARTGAVSMTGLWFGAMGSTAGKFASAPTQVASAFSTPDNGDEWVSKWITTPLPPNVTHLLAYGFTATAATEQVVGGNYYTATAADASSTSASVTTATAAPLDVWVEAETSATTPVIAVIGDSLSAGVGATLPVFDSALSQYARAVGALPIHYAASGDALSAFKDDAAYKWTRWESLSAPDAALLALGSNDVFGGTAIGTVQADWEAVASLARKRLSPNIYALTILPRTSATGTMETTRRSLNAWIKDGTRAKDVFDIVPAVSPDDETLTPSMDVDGTHLTTSGYAAVAGAVTRPVAESSPLRDSGIRDLTAYVTVLAAANTGYVRAVRVGNTVTLTLYNLKTAAAAGDPILALPAGFRPVFETYGITATYWTGQTGDDYRITAAGNVIVQSLGTDEPIHMNVTYMTRDPWPLTVPGALV